HGPAPEIRDKRVIMAGARQRGGDERQQEEENVLPEFVLEPPPGHDRDAVDLPIRLPADAAVRERRLFEGIPRPGRGVVGQLRELYDESAADILEVLAGLEADRAPGRDANLLARAGVPPDAPLARLHLEHAKAPQ